jgi:hypothetical protein
VELAERGHGLVIDHGWREVADKALDFIQRHVPPTQTGPTGHHNSSSR